MKKNYFFTLLLTLCFSAISFGQQAVITGYVDAPCSGATPRTVEVYVSGTIDFTGWTLVKQTNGAGFAPGSANLATIDISTLGSVTDAFVYITNSTTNLNTEFSISTNVVESGSINSNGDDAFQLVNSSSAVVDRFGEDGVDGSGADWEHVDTYAYRKDGATPNSGSFSAANWTFGAQNLLDGTCGSTLGSLVPFGTYMATASTTPGISITSPSNNAVLPGSTTEITINLNVENFTLSGDNGSEMTDNTGDGYIIGKLYEDGETPEPKNVFSTSETANVSAGKSYTLSVELVDNSGTSLSPKAEAIITFSVELPCDLVLGDIATTCDATTSGVDGYSGSIAFTGGNTGYTYTITAAGATIGGDNPNSIAAGTITFSGMTEGTNLDVTIVGDATSSCNFSRTLFSPTCYPLPIIENFDYTDGSLVNNPLWSNFSGTSGDLMVSSGHALVQHGTPSEDAQIKFTAVSGSIYYAMDFTVVDAGSPIPGSDNEYFAMFKDSGFGYSGRLDIVPPSTTGDFSVGIASDSSTADAVWATDLTYGVTYRVTVKFDQDTNIAQLWINAALETETSILGEDLSDPGRTIVAFALRQSDSNLNEGIQVDNLRIGTTFAETTLSVKKTEVEGFATYPNPITDKKFTISSSSSSVKEVAIFNVLGKKVFSSSFSGVKKNIDVSGVNTGVYILKVTEGGKTATKKLVIR